MKIQDLIDELEKCKRDYGDFSDWDIYTEQIDEIDKFNKTATTGFQANWDTVMGSEDWEYFKCEGYWTKFPDKKIFTINVNY